MCVWKREREREREREMRTLESLANSKHTMRLCWLCSHCCTLGLQNLFILHNWNFVPFDHHLPTSLSPQCSGQSPFYSKFLEVLTILDSSYSLACARFIFLCLPAFTQPNVFRFGERQSLQQIVLEKWSFYRQKNEIRPMSHHIQKPTQDGWKISSLRIVAL
jgi:hypothetical protein